MRILLLADADEPATTRLAEALRRAGNAVETATAAGAAELAARMGRVDAAVFDAAGATTLAELRRRLPGVPLAAWLRDRDDERVAELLAAGTDEVLHRGMGAQEQAARVAALAERLPRPQAAVTLGALQVDRERGEATWHGRRLGLTQRERDVLHELAAAGGATVRREALYRSVWGYAMTRGDRSVDVNVKRLRDKLSAEVGTPVSIETEPGVGYRLRVQAAVTAL